MIQKQSLVIVAVAVALFFVACSDDSVPSTAPVLKMFGAALTGAAERPAAVTTPATGTSNINVITSPNLVSLAKLDTNVVRVQTLVSSIDSVTQAHIHAGDATVAGPVMVFLAGPFSATVLVARGTANNAIGLTGVLSHVDITRGVTTFSGAFTFDSLLVRLNAGTAYVNVHTRKNPGGEIRGQIAVK